MKNIFFLLFIFTTISFGANDGYAGASLNRKNTIKKYKQLTKMTKRAIKYNDWFLKEQTIDEIENFMLVTEAYNADSSKGAKRNISKFHKALKKQLISLKRVDGMGGATLHQENMVLRYNYISKIIDNALKTGKNEDKAIEEAEDMLSFIKKWKSQQDIEASSQLNIYEEILNEKLKQLKK